MSKFFIERPVLANVLAIVIVLLGAVSYLRLPVAQYPNVVPPTISVTARYPGASAQTVIDTIALPIEQQVNGVDGMIYMQSTSAYDGTYTLIVTFEIGTDPNIAQVLVQNRVQLALAQLPEPVQAQGVNVQKKSTAVLMFVTLDSPDNRFDGLYLSNYATINLTSELSRLPGVGNVTVIGAGTYAMRVWMDPEKLFSFGLEPSDVIRAIRLQSQNVASGQVGTPPAPQDTAFQYTIDVQSRLNEPEQFGSIVIKDQTAQGGRLVYLRDVARIELGSQTYSQSFLLDGRAAAGIAIYQTPEANALQVGDAVKAKMRELSTRFPEGLRFLVPYDTTLFVKASIDEVYTTLYQAGVLVLVVILVFLQSFRAIMIPAQTVPVTIIGAFLAMFALGFTVNLSTLFGIVLAIGIVVDDAIMIVEGVSKEIERGLPGRAAAIKAMDGLFGPIIGITLVLMSVFLPTAFVPGLTGQMFAQFALVIAATALISAINAVTLKPSQSAVWLRAPVPLEKRFIAYRWFNRVYDACEAAYTRMIGWMVKRALVFVLIGLVVACGAVWGLVRLPTGFLPIDDQGYALVSIELPEGAALGRAQAVTEQATKIALEIPGVQQVIGIAGMSLLDNSADLSNSTALYVVFKPFDVRGKAHGQDLPTIARTLQARVTKELTDGRATVLPPPPIQGIGNAGGFQMQLEMLGGSFNYEKLNDIAAEMVKQAAADPRIGRALTTFRLNAPQVVMTVDRDRAETLRVSVGDVFSALTDYVGSTYVNQFNKFGQSLQVYVQADSRFRLNPDDLLKLHVRSSDNQMVPLGALATLSQTVGPALITMYNQYPSATIIGAPGRGYSDGQAIQAMEEIARRVLPSDMKFEWTAMSYQEKVTGNQIYYVFGLSLLLVYLCLAGQYESWILPLSVLSAVPLALVGPSVALAAVGADNNLYTQIGLVLLIALSAKNGILIVEVAREQYEKGKTALEAAVEASRERFRPILMTSFAFILGVLPLVLATGAGANARKSLGISVFSGMLASTCLAVVFVPSFFVVLQHLDARMRGRKKPESHDAPAQEPAA